MAAGGWGLRCQSATQRQQRTGTTKCHASVGAWIGLSLSPELLVPASAMVFGACLQVGETLDDSWTDCLSKFAPLKFGWKNTFRAIIITSVYSRRTTALTDVDNCSTVHAATKLLPNARRTNDTDGSSSATTDVKRVRRYVALSLSAKPSLAACATRLAASWRLRDEATPRCWSSRRGGIFTPN